MIIIITAFTYKISSTAWTLDSWESISWRESGEYSTSEGYCLVALKFIKADRLNQEFFRVW